MANWWNNRLVVHGPRADVERFRRAARVEPVRRRRSRTGKGRSRKRRAGKPLLLSFDKLVESLPASLADGVERDTQDPYDLGMDRMTVVADGTASLAYRFQLSHYDPLDLIKRVSTVHPAVCFVLGWVDPNSDSQGSALIHRGKARQWDLPAKIKERKFFANVPDDDGTNESEVSWALVEADWAMMDAVVDHWDNAVRAMLSRTRTRAMRLRHVGGRLA